jgi:TolB-like protein
LEVADKMKKYIAFLLVLLLAAGTAGAAESRKDKVKINVPKQLAASITENVSSEIADSHAFQIVERSQMDKIMKEQAFSLSGASADSDAVKIGQLAQAQKLLVGSVNKIGSSYIVTARIVDIEKGTVELATKVTATSENDLAVMTEELGRKLAGKAAGKKIVIDGKEYDPGEMKFELGQVISVIGSDVVLNMGESDGLRIGDTLAVFGLDRRIEAGGIVKRGDIEIKEVFKYYSKAVMKSGHGCLGTCSSIPFAYDMVEYMGVPTEQSSMTPGDSLRRE